MEEDCVIPNVTASTLYEVPLLLEREGLCRVACRKLGLPVAEPDMARWRAMVEKIHGVHRHVTIALVGKYMGLHDAYLSVVESLFHGRHRLRCGGVYPVGGLRDPDTGERGADAGRVRRRAGPRRLRGSGH